MNTPGFITSLRVTRNLQLVSPDQAERGVPINAAFLLLAFSYSLLFLLPPGDSYFEH